MLNQQRFIRILLTVIKVGVLLTIFLPLVMNSHFFFPFIVLKNVLFRIAVEIILAAYIILASLVPVYRPKFNQLVWAVLAFFGISTVATVFSLGPYGSFWGNYERMSGLFHHLHLVLYFFVLFNVFKQKKDWHNFFSFSVFASLLMSFFAFAQWLQVPFLMQSSGGSRLTGTLGNATFFAAYLLFNLFFIVYFWAQENRFNLKLFSFSNFTFDAYLVLAAILYKIFPLADWQFFNFFKVPVLSEAIKYPALFYPFLTLQLLIVAAWFLRAKKYSVRILLTLVFLFEFLIFFNTQTRGAMLGIFASAIFLSLVLLFLPRGKKLKTFGLGFLVVLLILPFSLLALKDLPVVKNVPTLNRLANISLTDITSESRLLTWQASWRGWTESVKSFLIGYGPEDYAYAFNKYFPVKIFKDSGSQIWFDRAHNIIFDVGVTTGIIGLAAYLAMLLLAARSLLRIYKKNRSLSSSWLFIGLIVAYFVQNFFVFDTLNTEILFYLFLAFVVFLTLHPDQENSETVYPPVAQADTNAKFYLLPIVAVILVIGLLVNFRTLKANNYIYKALTTNDVTLASEYFEKSIATTVVGRFELRQQFSNFAINVARNNQIPGSQRTQIVDRALTELEKSVKDEPWNVRHHLWLAGFYNDTARLDSSRVDKAITLINQGIPLSPDRPQLYLELGQSYLFKGDTKKAIEYFQLAVDKAPWVVESHLSLISVGILTDQAALVDQEFATLFQMNKILTINDYGVLRDLYLRVNNYPGAIAMQSQIINLEPQNSDAYFMLASIYFASGDENKATDAASQGSALNPQAPSASEFIKLLKENQTGT
ncbi:MAG: hypothetical protein A2744_02315 [Candidatus Buchananbacteria bacterium RIFCSPHIGHO2_01_FULL_44_11]|uniref:O-antigen ligase-related domain-containing protein n=1 Tax=Candidatus Buchananbacteria bacterium RIFCSPHIGHO2_01_FULL_44_11 TaxID=1797535 RepID=A0A1G1Y116_9BACT|nr:MAG: hypothetical protein A2744_02315 [Candidatus Buchananbacteria bacterium RIFCSPHIGHO2_01_FULL_44_11]